MSLSVSEILKYTMKCDKCGWTEEIHTGDSFAGTIVKNEEEAMRAVDFYNHNGKLLCSWCNERQGGR